MKILDLFCGAGGAAMGIHRALEKAGIEHEIHGVDNKPQKNYPFIFHLEDAMTFDLEGYGFYWASPPCQAYSVASVTHRNNGKIYPDLIMDTRQLLLLTRKPFIIENVPPAGKLLKNPITLCGTLFNLGVLRHRCFELSYPILLPKHVKHNGRIGDGKYFSIAGGAGRWKSWGTVYRNISKGTANQWRYAMGIDWMTRKELTQAIPPAYSEYLITQWLKQL